MPRLLVLLVLSLPLVAQMPRAVFNWWDSPLSRNLNLSEDQRRQIRDSVREFRPKLIDLRASVEKAELEVEDAFNDDNFDQRRASEAIEHLVAARGELTRTISLMSVRLRGVLTLDQWHTLQNRRNVQRQQLRQERVRPRGVPSATQPPRRDN
jgi:Spy/CpxP family protein refolding chaperone